MLPAPFLVPSGSYLKEEILFLVQLMAQTLVPTKIPVAGEHFGELHCPLVAVEALAARTEKPLLLPT